MRNPRHYPPNTVVEITARTYDGRHVLAPSRRVRDIVVSAVGRAQAVHGIAVHAIAALSNHVHLLVMARDPQQTAQFIGTVLSSISREVNKIRGTRGPVWQRHRPIPVSVEPEAQLERLCYVLAHGAKEGLVLDPRDWEGAHSARAVLDGEPMQALRLDRTAAHGSTPRRVASRPELFHQLEIVQHSPLPGFAHLDAGEYRLMVSRALESWLAERAPWAQLGPSTATVDAGAASLGNLEASAEPPPAPRPLDAVADDTERTTRLQRRRAPRCHAASHEVREQMLSDYEEFLDRYAAARADLRAGRIAVFPPWCFPPRLPFARGAGLVVAATLNDSSDSNRAAAGPAATEHDSPCYDSPSESRPDTEGERVAT